MNGRRGAALLLSILAIAILGAGLTGALLLSGVERRAVGDQLARAEALALAESGLERFVAGRAELGFTASPAGALESTRVQLAGGYADVVLERLRAAGPQTPALYAIRSRGVATTGQLSGVPAAERTVRVLAQWQAGTGTLPVLGAVTGLAGIVKTNSNGTISGVDQCLAQPTIGGVAVPAGGYVQNGRWIPSGNPAVRSLGPSATAPDSVVINWSGIASGTAIQEDVAIPGAAWPSFGNPTYWPIILVTGNYTLPSTGRGVLIVTGSLTIGNNGRNWNGLILVGDRLIVTANTTVQGAVIAGLNRKLGTPVAATTISSGNNRVFRYNSCDIASALNRFSGLAVLQDTWSAD